MALMTYLASTRAETMVMMKYLVPKMAEMTVLMKYLVPKIAETTVLMTYLVVETILNRDVGTATYSANVPPHGLSSSSCLPCPHWTPNTFVPDGYFEESASSTSWMVPLKSYPTVNGNGMAHPAPFK